MLHIDSGTWSHFLDITHAGREGQAAVAYEPSQAGFFRYSFPFNSYA